MPVKAATRSGSVWPPIPIQSGQRVRRALEEEREAVLDVEGDNIG